MIESIEIKNKETTCEGNKVPFGNVLSVAALTKQSGANGINIGYTSDKDVHGDTVLLLQHYCEDRRTPSDSIYQPNSPMKLIIRKMFYVMDADQKELVKCLIAACSNNVEQTL